MIQSLHVRNFRMMASNAVEIGPFHVLVGQNATGKSTFLAAIQFLADVLNKGVTRSVKEMAPNFFDLCFDPQQPIAFAIEVAGPHRRLPSKRQTSVQTSRQRYEIEIGIGRAYGGGVQVLRENLFVLPGTRDEVQRPSLSGPELREPIIHQRLKSGWRTIGKTADGKDSYRPVSRMPNSVGFHRDPFTKGVFRFGPDKPALANVPEEPEKFPDALAVRDLLRAGVRTLALDYRKLRDPSPPAMSSQMALDGSNVPHVMQALQFRDKVLFQHWVRHVATGVPGLKELTIREQPADKHLVLEATFQGDHRAPVPSWLLSDGTLRLIALTLLSYAAEPGSHDIYLVEEPENGLHPLAIQSAFQSLSSPLEDAQILCATHSPIFLAQASLEQALVFRRASEGYAIVRHGTEVPELRDWAGRRNLADLFASGVLS